MSHLRICEGCDRHVRAASSECPFCDRALEPAPLGPVWPRRRLGRAALMAFGGAAVAGVVAGCGDDSDPVPPYGAPPEDAGPGDAGNPAPPYGAPPDDAGGPAPAYGAAPADGG